jgi:hypothetical protein
VTDISPLDASVRAVPASPANDDSVSNPPTEVAESVVAESVVADALGTFALQVLTRSFGSWLSYVGAGVTDETYVGGGPVSLRSELRVRLDEKSRRIDMIDKDQRWAPMSRPYPLTSKSALC